MGAKPAGLEAVSLRGVTKTFEGTTALRDCSFTARLGEVHALVGENGSGKSTLAKLLGGVFSPDHGTVLVNGAVPTSPTAARKAGIAIVFQEILLAENATVLDNLYVGQDGLFRARKSLREKRSEARQLLDRLVGSPINVDLDVSSLSLNVRQWLVIARALLRHPRVVVFDESTAALDYESVHRFFEEVHRLRDDGVCVLIVTHRISELIEICDRATVLQDGRNVGTLSGAEISEDLLLEMMSTQSDAQVDVAPATASHATRTSEAGERLVVSGLQLTERAKPFEIDFCAGEVVGLVGLEGQGQTRFLRAVTGIARPVAGQISVLSGGSGRSITNARSAQRAGIAYVTGDRKLEGLFPNLSVIENFGILGYRRNSRFGIINRRFIRERFREQVERLAIRVSRPGAPLSSLSGGNQQKVVIARALASEPLVLALNDPTRGVDISAKHYLHGLLRSLADSGKIVLFLSNEIEEFVGLCDRVVVFRSDSLFAILKPSSITADSVLAAMFGHTEGVES